jgi:sugar lactone lactonase YvrE
MISANPGLSAKQLERDLGVTYKTAWRMSSLIRDELGRMATHAARPTTPKGVVPEHERSLVRQPGEILTFAGDGTPRYGGDGGLALGAQINSPYGLAIDDAGNVFIADVASHVVRRVDPSGIITTIAGTGVAGFAGDGGPALAATLNSPAGLAFDDEKNLLVVDMHNHAVRSIDAAGIITTVAGTGVPGSAGDGGLAVAAQMNAPSRVIPVAGTLLISEYFGNRIRRVDPSGVITTLAGDGSMLTSGDGGPAHRAGVVHPSGIALDHAGNLYVAQSDDGINSRIRMIDQSGTITTFAGGDFAGFGGDGGLAIKARLRDPTDVLVEPSGAVLIADYRNCCIRRVDPAGVIRIIVGTGHYGFDGNGGPARRARLTFPVALALTPSGDLLFSDHENHRIRRVIGPIA